MHVSLDSTRKGQVSKVRRPHWLGWLVWLVWLVWLACKVRVRVIRTGGCDRVVVEMVFSRAAGGKWRCSVWRARVRGYARLAMGGG